MDASQYPEAFTCKRRAAAHRRYHAEKNTVKYIEKDPALERRFQPVHVEEPSEEETLQILQGLRPAL